jgi:hypothetical protein
MLYKIVALQALLYCHDQRQYESSLSSGISGRVPPATLTVCSTHQPPSSNRRYTQHNTAPVHVR